MLQVKRRRNFENTQDKQKRKVKELRLKKSKKFQRPPTWEETNSTVDPAPFADMFGEPDDIFAEVSFGSVPQSLHLYWGPLVPCPDLPFLTDSAKCYALQQ